jgi:acyl-CoA synthetase (AMP-forming)/AMP-acid ligase II
MTNLYVWLKFFHLFGLSVFLFAHGVSGGASLALRAPVSRRVADFLGCRSGRG